MVITRSKKYGLLPKVSGQMPLVEKPELPTFDLSRINVVQLAKDLSKQISKPQPENWLKKWWTNAKLPMDNERLEHLNTYIERIRIVNKSLTDMQTELYIQPKILHLLMKKNIEGAEQEIELQLKEHEAKLTKLDEEMAREKLDTAKIKAEIKDQIAKTRITELQGNFLAKIIEEVDLSKPTPEIVLLIIKAMDTNAQADLGSAVNQPIIEQMVGKLKEQTRSLKSQADMDEQTARYQKSLTDKRLGDKK